MAGPEHRRAVGRDREGLDARPQRRREVVGAVALPGRLIEAQVIYPGDMPSTRRPLFVRFFHDDAICFWRKDNDGVWRFHVGVVRFGLPRQTTFRETAL